jgi:maleate isomerase
MQGALNDSHPLLARCAPATPAERIKKIGHITPSSNTTLEPLTTLLGLLAGGCASHHFARVSVRRLTFDADANRQFERERMLAAARLLAEAPLDAIAWNGTAGSWLGLDHDVALVDAIAAETGVPATTATLAMDAVCRRGSFSRVGLVCPYTDDIAHAIGVAYARRGLDVVATSNLGLVENHDMGNVSEATIRGQLDAVATARPDCIVVVCTNLSAITITAEFEAASGIAVVDSIAATFAETSRMAGCDVRVPGMGRLLSGAI